MEPWKRACAGSEVSEEVGMKSREAEEYPPMSASDIVLQFSIEDLSLKFMRS